MVKDKLLRIINEIKENRGENIVLYNWNQGISFNI